MKNEIKFKIAPAQLPRPGQHIIAISTYDGVEEVFHWIPVAYDANSCEEIDQDIPFEEIELDHNVKNIIVVLCWECEPSLKEFLDLKFLWMDYNEFKQKSTLNLE